MSGQLERYLIGALGFAFVAVWLAAGGVAALLATLSGAAFYGVAALAQSRGERLRDARRPRRPQPAEARSRGLETRGRPARSSPARPGRALSSGERSLESAETAVSYYRR
jgi:hypothetical protein